MVAWVSLEGGDKCWLCGIPMHHSHLPALASPMALRKGAGGGPGLLKGQDLEKTHVVPPLLKEEGSESFQMLSPTSKSLLLL